MKKIQDVLQAFRLIAFAMLLTSVSAIAGGVVLSKAAHPFQGAYAGTSFGVLQNLSTIERSSVAEGLGTSDAITPDPSSYSNNFVANLSLGYGMTWSRFYLAGELSGDFSEHEQITDENRSTNDNNVSSTTNKASVVMDTFGFNADVLPGFLLSLHALLYGRIGLAVNQVTLNTRSSATGQSPTKFAEFSASDKRVKAGLRVGLGLERWVSRCIALRFDYVYTFFGRMSLYRSENTGASTLNNAGKTKIGNQKIMLGLVYHLSPITGHDSMDDLYHLASGFYVGIGGGVMQNLYHMNGLSRSSGDDRTQLTSIHHITTTRGAGVAFVGYVTQWKKMFLAAEAGTTIVRNAIRTTDLGEAQGNGETTFTESQIKLSTTNFHFDILPGFFLGNSTVIYPRIGLVTTRIHLNTDTTVTDTVGPSPAIDDTLSLNNSIRKVGLRVGIGLEQAITKHLLLRLDYIYQYIGDITVSQTGEFPNSSTIENTTRVKVRNQNVLLSLVYNFGSY